ncbi:hypothetical protein NQZ68_004288 [Dissostichus eleginoides]|nr:hypothetical protein NQZ68_004288 [Dissostichus eleginoides]
MSLRTNTALQGWRCQVQDKKNLRPSGSSRRTQGLETREESLEEVSTPSYEGWGNRDDEEFEKGKVSGQG